MKVGVEEECVVLAWASDLSVKTSIVVRMASAIGITSDYKEAEAHYEKIKDIRG